jgi:hypothetical protein
MQLRTGPPVALPKDSHQIHPQASVRSDMEGQGSTEGLPYDVTEAIFPKIAAN